MSEEERQILIKLDNFMYELKISRGELRNSLYKHINNWIQENNLNGDLHDFVNIKQNKDE